MDIRSNTRSAEVLINLNGAIGKRAEAKCVSSHPTRTELLAVGANDPFVRIYDRRMIRPQPVRMITCPGGSLPRKARFPWSLLFGTVISHLVHLTWTLLFTSNLHISKTIDRPSPAI